MIWRKWLLIAYLAFASLYTFFLWGLDKRRAINKQRRIAEKKLLQATMWGGGLGALMGMSFFRHKKFKGTFLWKFWLIMICRMIPVFYVFIYR